MNARCAMSARKISAKRGLSPPRALPVAQPVFRSPMIVQRKCACGGGCEGCQEEKFEAFQTLQTRLTVNASRDTQEQEADRVADQVMRLPEGSAGPKPTMDGGTCDTRGAEQGHEHEQMHLKSTESVGRGRTVPPIVDEVLRSPGQPLDEHTRTFMEPRFGLDFSDVRVHTNARAAESARAIDALAYTVGRQIVFAAGKYVPRMGAVSKLLAHELTHVVQQGRGQPKLQRFAACNVARLSGEECPPREHGEISRSKFGPMVFLNYNDPIQRIAGVLIANFEIGSSTIKSNLNSTLYWKQFLQTIESNRSKWEILGFTDCEGNEALNKDLRKSRAEAMYKVLPASLRPQIQAYDGAPLTDCITENGGQADRTLNRSVLLRFKEYVADIKEPTVVEPHIKCGPDVTEQIVQALAGLKSRFDGLSSDQQEDVCGTLNSPLSGAYTWDIPLLYHDNNGWISQNYQPACASPGGDPHCGESVQVGKDCYYSGTANYVIFGAMCRLCQQNLDESIGSDYDEDHMLELIDFYKGPGVFFPASGNWRACRRWAQAGYHGWPNGGSPPAGDRNNCAPLCHKKYSGPPFEARWCPHIDPYDQCGFWNTRGRMRGRRARR